MLKTPKVYKITGDFYFFIFFYLSFYYFRIRTNKEYIQRKYHGSCDEEASRKNVNGLILMNTNPVVITNKYADRYTEIILNKVIKVNKTVTQDNMLDIRKLIFVTKYNHDNI